MINFRFVTHLDTTSIMPRLVALMPSKWAPIEARGEMNNEMIGMGASKLLRAHKDITRENWLQDLPVEPEPVLDDWKSMQRLLVRCRDSIMKEELAQRYLSGEMARAMISRLDAGSSIFWHTDNGKYHDRTIRFHLPLVTNPGCLMYSGPEMAHWEVGTLFYFNNKVRHSAANWGASNRLHLIFEMYRIEKNTDEPAD